MRHGRISGARLILAALLLGGLALPPAAAQVRSPALDPDEWGQPRQPPLPLPEGLRSTIRPRPDAQRVERVDRIAQVFQAIQSCWRPPAGSGYSGQEITLRLSFKRSGEVLGQPRITYYKAGTQGEQREPFTRAVREAFERCTPLPFTESFGRAIAGRIFSFRFVDAQPM
ncbi:hypothetical protein [Microvirga splendida]|uniref:Cell envelope integrity protein TolA n=1 Tax=Microvirga splendida TaxID=2795727 RepID=A0ABS0XZQ7_9HYPH|nr:hypothetical protein [Microvirga splendida]MBJ6125533.1 hypothetical protein [Microvirga splendida]